MCGRFSLATPLGGLVEHFGVDHTALERWLPRFNVAPTQEVPVVIGAPDGRRMGLMRWGLVPSWADDPSTGVRMINARAETVGEKPAFRSAYAKRRCLVPADGFYEWQRTASGSGPKPPFFIGRIDGAPLGMAGLWERWRPRSGGEPWITFTLLTVDAPVWMRPLHHRMPLVLEPEEWETWLEPGSSPEALDRIRKAPRGGGLEAWEVSSRVNRPANDDRSCVEPIADGRRYPQASTGVSEAR